MLKSNLKSVIARLEEYQRGIPGCLERALDKGYWLAELRAKAETVLRAQFAGIADVQTRARYEKFLPMILDTLSVKARPGTRLFELWLPAETLSDVNLAAASKYAGQQWTPTGRDAKRALPNPLAEMNYQAARQAILDWVETEKHWETGPGGADEGLTADQIADRIERIIGLAPAMRARTAEMDAAAEGLVGAIEAWLSGAETTPSGNHAVVNPATDPLRYSPTAASRLPNAHAKQWLELVLQTWVVYFRLHVRDRLEAELNKLKRKVRAPQQSFM